MSFFKFFFRFFSRTTAPAVETPSFLLPETAARFSSAVKAEEKRRAAHNAPLQALAAGCTGEAKALEREAGRARPARAELLRRCAAERRRQAAGFLNQLLGAVCPRGFEESARAWERERILSGGVVVHSSVAYPSPYYGGGELWNFSAWEATRRNIARFGGRYFLAVSAARAKVRVTGTKKTASGSSPENCTTWEAPLYSPTGEYSEEWETRFITGSVQQFTAAELAAVAADEAAQVK